MSVKRTVMAIICPSCGQSLEAAFYDGKAKGRCAVAGEYVVINIEGANTMTANVAPIPDGPVYDIKEFQD